MATLYQSEGVQLAFAVASCTRPMQQQDGALKSTARDLRQLGQLVADQAHDEAIQRFHRIVAHVVHGFSPRPAGRVVGLGIGEEDEAPAGVLRDLALDVFAYRVQKYVGAYAAAMNGVDAIVFTAGLGENSISMRESIAEAFGYLGAKIDKERNNVRGKACEISTADSKVKLFVIPTNEELMIARDTKSICLG